jgi:hypothetical protein
MRIDAHKKWRLEKSLSSSETTKPSQIVAFIAIVEGYQRETDEDSEAVRGRFDRCRCRSDSLAVISYRDINVNTP